VIRAHRTSHDRVIPAKYSKPRQQRERTLREVGDELGLSHTYVLKLETQAMLKIAPLVDELVRDLQGHVQEQRERRP